MEDRNGIKESFPTRERGLKRTGIGREHMAQQVVPYAGTWIETAILFPFGPGISSFPTRERGLKLAMSVDNG